MPNRVLLDLLHGRGAHVDPVACAEGLNVELAGRQLTGAQHTIWQLVWHMNYWMDYELRSIAGPEAAYPAHASESWPVVSAPADESQWETEVVRLRHQVQGLGEWARQSALEGLGARLVHPTKSETMQDVLWQMMAHNSYHTGQIALLRRAFGAWPPSGGGDSW
jgi:uncharacterized damage-inducible protein DinB